MSVFDALNKPLTFSPRPAKLDAKPPRTRVEVGGVPRVNLMPPSVEADRRMRRGVRMAGAAVVLSVVVAGAAVGFSGYVAMQSAGTLLAENDRTADLLSTQTEYADVARAIAATDTVRNTQALLGADDVQWAPFVGGLSALLPEGSRFSNVSIQAVTPLAGLTDAATADAGATTADPTVTAAAAITVRTGDLAVVDAWIKKIVAVEGIRGATVTNVTMTDGVYDATVAVAIGDEVLSNKYLPEDLTTSTADGAADTASTTGTGNRP